MPLPPAPTRRGSQLSTGDFSAKTSAKSRASAGTARDEPLDNDLLDIDMASPVAAPAVQRRAQAAAPAPKAARSKRAVAPVAASAKPQAAPAQPAPPARSPAVADVISITDNKPAKAAKPRSGKAKLFVLDTNVLLHDPSSLFRFEEHDIYLPMIVLEELDGHKKGMTEVARNGRQASRTLDALVARLDQGFGQLDGADRDLVLSGSAFVWDRDGDRVVDALNTAPPADLAWRYQPMADQHHDTIYDPSVAAGLRWLFPAR